MGFQSIFFYSYPIPLFIHRPLVSAPYLAEITDVEWGVQLFFIICLLLIPLHYIIRMKK